MEVRLTAMVQAIPRYLPASITANIAILQQLGVLGIVAMSGNTKSLIFRNIAKIASTRDRTRNARRSRRVIDSWSFFVHFVDFVSTGFSLCVLVSGVGHVDAGKRQRRGPGITGR
jgi:hypothetical protein